MNETAQTTLMDTFKLFESYLPDFARTGLFSPGAQRYTGTARALYRPVAMVTHRTAETADTVSLSLMPPSGYPAFRAGQHIDVAVEIRGVRHVRQYSLTGSSGSPSAANGGFAAAPLQITVKRQNEGLVSNYLHDLAFVGNRLEISAPKGDFVVTNANAATYVFCSAGSGITPVYAMARELLASGKNADIYFYHAARSAESVIFRAELEHLAEKHENFYPIFFLSKAEGAEKRRLNFKTLAPLMGKDLAAETTEIFLCGPGDFVQDLQDGFQAAKFNALHSEFYTLPTAAVTAGTVNFLKSGAEIVATGNLLEAAEGAGIKAKHGCRRGICHECKVHKKSGTVKNILTGAETHGDENIQLCISQAVGKVEVEL
jgi:ferredoxin-NADP reductase